MRLHPLKVLALVLLCGFCSCKTQQPDEASSATETGTFGKRNFDVVTRNNALALLDDLLGDEKNVSKILIIKHNSDELGRVIEDISKTAGEGAKTIEAWAKADPRLDLKQLNLPPGEAGARKEISKAKEHLLLHSKDEEFEFQLLLTQVEALNYGANLALVAAEEEPDADRTRALLSLSRQFRELHERVLAMLGEGRRKKAE